MALLCGERVWVCVHGHSNATMMHVLRWGLRFRKNGIGSRTWPTFVIG